MNPLKETAKTFPKYPGFLFSSRISLPEAKKRKNEISQIKSLIHKKKCVDKKLCNKV